MMINSDPLIGRHIAELDISCELMCLQLQNGRFPAENTDHIEITNGVPDGAKLIRVGMDLMGMYVALYFEHESFAVYDGESIEAITPVAHLIQKQVTA